MATGAPGYAVDRAPPGAASRRPHAVIIGSGFGGLAAAVRLGARGYRVTVLERLDAPGGRAYVHRRDGYTFDAGPTIVTAPFLLEELWALAGRRMSDDIDLRALDPFYRIRFHDGTSFERRDTALDGACCCVRRPVSSPFGLVMVGEFFRRSGWDVRFENPKPSRICTPGAGRLFRGRRHHRGLHDALKGVAPAILAARRASCNRSLGVLVGGSIINARRNSSR